MANALTVLLTALLADFNAADHQMIEVLLACMLFGFLFGFLIVVIVVNVRNWKDKK